MYGLRLEGYILENQMNKKMEDEINTEFTLGFTRIQGSGWP